LEIFVIIIIIIIIIAAAVSVLSLMRQDCRSHQDLVGRTLARFRRIADRIEEHKTDYSAHHEVP
jgi:hypothetical protein